ncbi:glycosyltransferase family 24 protein [Vararia minispora EC-137]|uniref:Glycosyltransferase family 24 protein n=1 Tax=Vararia minispora EC-137 TaxID=1314806 RepID=A0ACB8QAE9_9AGAM|nr:glycosyltransferase family 24 protein [Vararia minispora EC-137]
MLVSECLSASSPVKVSMQTSWKAPSTLLELIETIAIQEPDAFFPLLDALTDPEILPPETSRTPEALEQLAFHTAISLGWLTKPLAQESARMDFALHSASPKLEAFYQYYNDTAEEIGASRDLKSCGSWVYWYGEVVCDSERLYELTAHETIGDKEAAENSTSFVRPRILPFDHIYPPPAYSTPVPPRTAILFASISSSNFRELHTYLRSLSSPDKREIEYVFRPIPDSKTESRTPLSGYGVTLDLKKTDYLVIDDRLANNKASSDGSSDDQKSAEEVATPDVDRVLTVLERYEILNESIKLTDPLTDDELTKIGLQATQLVMESDNPLAALKQLSQDFPRYASSIARRVVPSVDITNEASLNSMYIPPGHTLVWLNGAPLAPDRMNPFSLLRLIRKEEDVMLSLMKLGLLPNASFELMTHSTIDAPYTRSDVLEGIFDASDREEGGDLIIWLNDLEKDERCGQSLVLMQPPYPGSAPGVRLNLLNVVLALDLSTNRPLYFIVGTVYNLIQRALPIRFGVVPLADNEESVQMAKIVSYLMKTYDLIGTASYLKQVCPAGISVLEFRALITWSASQCTTEDAALLSWDEVLETESEEESTMISKAREYAERLDIDGMSSPAGHAFINGRHYPIGDTFLGILQTDINKFLQYVQEQLYSGVMDDSTLKDPSVYFYDLPTSFKRRNHYVIPSGNPIDITMFSLPEVFDKTNLEAPGMFVYPADLSKDNKRVPCSMYLVGDFDQEGGFAALQYALIFLATYSPRSRISFVHNPSISKGASEPHTAVSKVLAHLITSETIQHVSPEKLLHALKLHVPGEEHPEQELLKSRETLQEIMSGVSADAVDQEVYAAYVRQSKLIAQRLGLEPGEIAVLVNGRLVGPLTPARIMPEDLDALEKYEFTKRVQPTLDALDVVHPGMASSDDSTFSHLVSTAVSIVSDIRIPDPSEASLFNTPLSSRNTGYRKLKGEHTQFTLGDEDTALIRFGLVLDTLSEEAQKYSSLLEWASNLPYVHIEVHLLPAPYTEMPLKRFYRYNLLPTLVYDEAGEEIVPFSVFGDLPTEPIYTLGLDEPPSWLVRPREALYDLDNIQLGVLSGAERATGIEAKYELDYIIVDGHALEGRTVRPPRGVQLQLVAGARGAIADTLVMANLGYLQFKAAPGVYALEIREGRGREIYEIESVGNDGWNSLGVGEEGGDVVTVTSFEGLTLYPRLTRRPGMERADVLAPTEAEEEGFVDSILSNISSFFGGKKEKEVAKPPSRHADINIFTVASGMLYERFASIMILSVLRNTNHTVKFWFIENFLSPSFLEFIPHFAKEYNFEYELVTYKWPKFLRKQSEKQRIIWAYKILFLDVLFPMDLDRVIFVDADQIVRADLYELVEMDLQGAPYAYTPMGDDNTDMEGFRFWKHGYWQQTLKGRPYHISALYVIDLNRFREFAAGDILRSHYHELSADPNSLANLDQDLPNNLQAYVPIYSLHEDWLWCETWCSKDRFDRAKTIDLCQNPLTKEPKLARARQIPEWETYDAEIARFARRLADEGRIRASAAAADVAQLANAAAGKTAEAEVETEEQGVQETFHVLEGVSEGHDERKGMEDADGMHAAHDEL